MTPGEKLREWRGERTQSACAGEIGVLQSTWARIESGTIPEPDQIQAIQELTGGEVSLADFADFATKRRKATRAKRARARTRAA